MIKGPKGPTIPDATIVTTGAPAPVVVQPQSPQPNVVSDQYGGRSVAPAETRPAARRDDLGGGQLVVGTPGLRMAPLPTRDARPLITDGEAFGERFTDEHGVLPWCPMVLFLHDARALNALGASEAELVAYVRAAEQFNDLVSAGSIFGEMIELPPTPMANGKMRASESGERIDLDAVRRNGVDPNHVLVFRRTQPGGPNPEAFWTTDFSEVTRGLSQEISGEARKTSVLMVSTLAEIAADGGLMRDGNDDGGLSVRRIDAGAFEQSRALAVF